MIESARGIILRTLPLTETSLIVRWLTKEFGRLTTVARGARRPRSPFQGKLDLFYEADFSFSRSRRSDLHVLREVSLRNTHDPLRREVLKLQQAAYGAAFVELATETETPLPGIFALFRGFLDCLGDAKMPVQMVFAFELKLLRELGLEPPLEPSGLTAGTRRIVRCLMQGDRQTCLRLRLAGKQAAELRQFLHGFMIFHLGRLPRGRGAALGGEI
ncbi:MAG: DNA repair protein RecO [Verrucomicrobiota bacterium]|nr:DNA repair protein RecO [Verrucomicrobiota bacterium]